MKSASGSSGRRLALAIVDTDQHVLAHAAVRQCLASMAFEQVLIFSDRAEPWGGLPVIPIPVLSRIEDYNRLVTTDLARHLDADAVLVVQFDGFILNPQEFSPHFWHYDYIGAPWPQFAQHAVGNGGFSWRSRRLVEAVASVPWDGLEAEDLHIARRLRPVLETAHACRFAPRSLASHFSVEHPAPPYPTFGFHGIFHLPAVYRHAPDFLIRNLSDRIVVGRADYLLPGLELWAPQAADELRLRRQRLVDARSATAAASALALESADSAPICSSSP